MPVSFGALKVVFKKLIVEVVPQNQSSIECK